MPRSARKVVRLPEEVLEDADSEFRQCAMKALEGVVANQRELADRLGWSESAVSSALKGKLTFRSWPRICRALGRHPVEELVRGLKKLREDENRDREACYRKMIERAEADTMLAFWRKLSDRKRRQVAKRMNDELESDLPS